MMDSTRPRGNVAERVYEDFEPTLEWALEPAADTLLIHLPGFSKEQLKVQVTTSRDLRISGERQLGENRWSRFRKEIPISSNYDTNEISAKFERGILFVRQPKIIVPDATKPQQQVQPPVEAPKADQKPSQEKAQPPIQAPSKPDRKPSVNQEKVETTTEVPKPPKPAGHTPSESAPEKQPQEKLKQPTEASKNEKSANEQQPEDSVPKIGTEKQKSGKIEGKANAKDNISQKTPRKEESSSHGLAEAAGKGNATPSTSSKQENLDHFAKDSTKSKNDKSTTGLITGADKLRMESYKKAFSGLVRDMKKPGKLVSLVLVILFVAVLGMYGMNAIRSFRKSEN